jgi:hypothetical protein
VYHPLAQGRRELKRRESGHTGLVRVVVNHIWPGGTVVRRSVDTAQRSEGIKWEELVAQGLAVPPPYRAYPGSPICQIQVDERVVIVAEHDLTGPLLDLVTAVLEVGDVV